MKWLLSLSLLAILSTPMFLIYTKGESVDIVRKRWSQEEWFVQEHHEMKVKASSIVGSMNLFAFYYPWYGTPDVSGYWFHWNDATHNPDNFLDGKRQIAAKHYPLLEVYDSNNESLIKRHVDIAKRANIDGFVVSWWGRNSFEENALSHIKNVCEQNDFKFTVYYETTSGVSHTIDDLMYLLDNYADSSSWYRIDGRPVIYVYGRALNQLNPLDGRSWHIGGDTADWRAYEDIRSPGEHGIFVIHPYEDDVGYVESNPITLPPNDIYSLETSISVMRDDCSPNSDVGFRIKVRNGTEDWQTLDELIVNFNDGWLDLSYDISSYAGETVLIRVESFAGGVYDWCSEWAAVDYFYIVNSEGRIINQNPYLDNEWRVVIDRLNADGYNPYIIVDSLNAGMEYFLDFTDGVHTYIPGIFSLSLSEISEIYNEASNIAHSKNKTFVATIVPGYDDTEIRSPGNVVDRQNGSFYNSLWSVAKSSFPDEYVITSFNEWHEGTEIEPSLEYGDLYINLTYLNTLGPPVHDVAVEDVSPSKTVVGQGSTTSINVTAVNQGDYVENFNVTVHANSTIIGRQTVNLAHGAKTTLQIIWDTADIPLGNYTIKAEASQIPGEIETSDNTLTYSLIQISILGDIDGSGEVNIVDVSKAAFAFDTKLGDEKWNPNADINEDRVINIVDISKIAKEFGKTRARSLFLRNIAWF